VTFLLLLSGKSYGWTWNDSILFTPQQLREDADFFFENLQRNHPYIYYYCGMEEFERKKYLIYEKLNVSMTGIRFLELMNTMNPCLDTHTRLPRIADYYMEKMVQAVYTNNELLFPAEDFRNGKPYCKVNDLDVPVQSINGVEVQSMLALLDEWDGIQPVKMKEHNIPNDFIACLYSYFDIHPPFEIEYEENGQSFRTEVKGISIVEEIERAKKRKEYRDQHSSVYYQVYPQSSTAILYLRSFVEEELNKSEYIRKMDELAKKLRQHKIRNLFVDVSKNGGGDSEYACRFFDYLNHDTICLNYSMIKRESSSITKYAPYNRTILRLPQENKQLFSGNLFVLQSMFTFSAADYFCRVIAQNKLGALIGQETGTFTLEMTDVRCFELPHTGFPFCVASSFWDFSRDFNTETLAPDMYWKTNFQDEFSEEELQAIVKQWEKQKEQKNKRTNFRNISGKFYYRNVRK
jgi:hypothetical protein